MGVNKVVFGAVSIMDISDSTVTPAALCKGATAYDKSGEKITGTIPVNGATGAEIDGLTVTSYTIPAGYTTGGMVSLTDDIERALASI